jgi:hypothetical protein
MAASRAMTVNAADIQGVIDRFPADARLTRSGRLKVPGPARA